MSNHKHYPYSPSDISESLKRVGRALHDVVYELSRENRLPLTVRTLIKLARGIALHACGLRIAAGSFDCPNGRDALSSVAHSMSQQELLKLADGNALALSKRWSQVVYAASLDLSEPGVGVAELRRNADIQDDPPRSRYQSKLFDKWMTK